MADSSAHFLKEIVQHPIDQLAQSLLENRIASHRAARAVIDRTTSQLETDFYLENLANNTRATPTLAPGLYRILMRACAGLGVTPPSLFIDTDPAPNAWTLGAEHPSIVLTSGLIDLMDENELLFILGHEIGHLVCAHTRYRVMTERYQLIAKLLSLIPVFGSAFATSRQVVLSFWYRRSELSADRFGVLCLEDPIAALSALTKLAGASKHLDPHHLKTEMLAQANEFRAAYLARGEVASLWDVLEGLVESAELTHPWPAIRLWEIEHWLPSEHYASLLKLDFESAKTQRLRVETFFPTPSDAVADPFDALLAELSGEFGQSVSNLVEKGRSFLGGMLKKSGPQETPS